MHIELFDTSGFAWSGLAFPPVETPPSTIQAEDLDRWFFEWACDRKGKGALQKEGLFLIHANGRFTRRAHQQDLQGIEILKHIRLTRWLGPAQAWHAIVYSFEPLTSILGRKPGDLILTSPGVTFLRLPEALSLGVALMKAYPNEAAWASLSLQEILARLPKASPQDRGFRRYIACDYTPPDSAHSISNWWGIYEMFLAVFGTEFPEYSDDPSLPERVRDFVLRLETKKAGLLEGSRASSPLAQALLEDALKDRRSHLIKTSARKTITYVDDEASNGWTEVLARILSGNGPSACRLQIIDKASLQLLPPDSDINHNVYVARIHKLANTINQQRPDLLILDLRLLGNGEAQRSPYEASGMDLARAVRSSNRYLPILLFTASNKAETLAVSGSLDIDGYWMKPGLGEHRGLASREEDLLDLLDKLTILLGDDYAWLQRISGAVERIRASKGAHWWEMDVNWPTPVGSPQPDLQRIDTDRHQEVLEYLESILYTARMILKLQATTVTQSHIGNNSGLSLPIVPDSVSGRLCTSLLNQIGQVVELIHNASDWKTDPIPGILGGKAGNDRMGGFWDYQSRVYVFRRRDWWAFYLFAWRNKFSHPGAVADFHDLKRAASDLIAWLISPRVEVKPTNRITRENIARAMCQLGTFKNGRYPVLRLDDQEPSTPLRISRIQIFSSEPKGPNAQDVRFRDQLVMRPEFKTLGATSRRLLYGA